jgi:hypothetical protein
MLTTKEENFQLIYSSAGDLLSTLKALQQALEPFFKEKKNCRVTALCTMPELKENKFDPARPIYSISAVAAISWDLENPGENEIKFLKDKFKENYPEQL